MSNESTKTGAPIAPPSLFAALAHAIALAKAVKHDGVNLDDKYAFASSEAVIGACRVPLSSSGLALLPVSATIVLPPSDKGSAIWHTTWRLVHSSGESIELEREWPVVRNGGKPADKATATAATTTLAYLLRDLLLLPRVGADDEMNKPAPIAKPAPAATTSTPSPALPSPAAPRDLKAEAARLELLRNETQKVLNQLPKDMKGQAWDEYRASKNDLPKLVHFLERARAALAVANSSRSPESGASSSTSSAPPSGPTNGNGTAS